VNIKTIMAKTAERTKTKTAKKSAKKSATKKNKPGVKNSLVNNIKTWKIIGKKRSETDVGMKLDLQPFNSTKN